MGSRRASALPIQLAMMSRRAREQASPTGREPSSLINAIRFVRERWWLVLITAVVGFVVALGAALHSTKQYTATSTLLVTPVQPARADRPDPDAGQ